MLMESINFPVVKATITHSRCKKPILKEKTSLACLLCK